LFDIFIEVMISVSSKFVTLIFLYLLIIPQIYPTGKSVENCMGVKLGLWQNTEVHTRRIFENKVLRGKFGLNSEVTGGWRKLHNEELRNLYPSPIIIRMITSRRMRWEMYVAQMGRSVKLLLQ
jgi:hypothetical protein